MTEEARQARIDARIGLALFALATLALWATERQVGFVRDESVYFHAAENHARWFASLGTPSAAFGDAAIARAFDYNHEHPALMKSLYGLSFMLFSETLGWLRPATAFRVPAFLVSAALLPLLFALGRRLFGRPAAFFAAASFLLVPRHFFHAHLACFDMPIVTMWVAVVYAFHRAQASPRWWLYTGVAFGLALATKHNGFFLVPVLMPFALVQGWRASRNNPEARALYLAMHGALVFAAALYGVMVLALGPARVLASFTLLSPQVAIAVAAAVAGGVACWRLARVDAATFRATAPVWAMAVLGPAIFYLHWPWLWHHPVDRAAWYLQFHLTHNHYPWFYLGELLRGPPFPLSYVLVKTALTVPASLVVPMGLGFAWLVARVVRGRVTLLEVLVGVNAVASIALISQPDVPHFGGVKHWMPSMPFLALLAAGVLERGARALSSRLGRWPALTPTRVFGGLAVLCAAPAVIATARLYEYGTSAYGEFAGGVPGAASLGMQRQYWANNVTGVLPWLNANARPQERVYLHECHGGQISDYQRNGMLRSDLVFVGSPEQADIVAYQYHQEFRETEFATWQAFGTTRPVTGLYLDETPQVVVYRRPR